LYLFRNRRTRIESDQQQTARLECRKSGGFSERRDRSLTAFFSHIGPRRRAASVRSRVMRRKEVDVSLWKESGKLITLAAFGALLIAGLGAHERDKPDRDDRHDKRENAYLVQNLVSDGSIEAAHTDPLLINAWGIAASPTGPWWVADNATNVSTLYNAAGVAQSLIVKVAGAPTGMMWYAGAGFVVSNGAASAPSRFLFAAEDGTISGWAATVPPPAPSTQSFVVVPNASAPAHDAIYKGLAVAQTAGGDFLYAADFHNGRVDVFDSSFHPVNTPGAFVNPRLPKRFAPFGIQNIGGRILVAYAKQDEDAEDEIAGEGLGFVSAFDTAGTFLARIASRDALNAPCGIALAPEGFGRFSGDLLVGNFGDGRINAFDPETFEPRGHLKNTKGKAIVIDGLWGIGFGNNGQAGLLTTLYFAAGPHDEMAGLFGRIDAQ
jgi:uncharacterized protein (TIGR03118 family)